MKSLRSEMTVIAVLPVVIIAILIGTIGLWSVNHLMTTYSERVLISLAEEQGSRMERVFENIEHTAHMLKTWVANQVNSTQMLAEPGFLEKHNRHATGVILSLAKNTPYADSLYIRFNPKLVNGNAGIFYVRNDPTHHRAAGWVKASLTDLTHADSDTSQSLAWWHEPVRKGKGLWVMSHLDNVLNADTISYSIPLYIGKELVAVVGVDTRVSVLAKFLKNIDIYKTASSFITDENQYILFHPEEDTPAVRARIERDSQMISEVLLAHDSQKGIIQYTNPDREKIVLADKPLTCGLHLIVSARQEEIYAEREQIIGYMLLVMGIVVAVLLIGIKLFVNRMLMSIQALINASERISKGEIEGVHLPECNRDDEIGRLTQSLKATMQYLRKYINRVNDLAYKDLMTGVKNRTHYLETINQFNAAIASETPEFCVTVFDVNNLKRINDTLGHETGDAMIMQASDLICKTYKHSPVFRIGGDEFVVISTADDYNNRDELLSAFKQKVLSGIWIEKKFQLVIACGLSSYNPLTDYDYETVFSRADKAMYENKLELKNRSSDDMSEKRSV